MAAPVQSMEITSLDANPLVPITDLIDPIDPSSDGSQADSLVTDQLSNAVFVENSDQKLGKKQIDKSLAEELSSRVFTEELVGINLSHSKQKDDCLYLYSQDQEVNSATKILEAIAPSTMDLDGSVLFAEGIRRIKLHGQAWALGLDLPIAQAAIVSAEIIAALLTKFQEDAQVDTKLAEIKFKLLLQSNCLNLLCETPSPLLQAAIALPMLNILRTVDAAEYFQAVTVSSRVIGEKQPSWSFEIDLLAIGIPQPDPELELEPQQQDALDLDKSLDIQDERSLSAISLLITNVQHLIQYLIRLRWLGQNSPQILSKGLSVPAGVASVAIGLIATIAIDRVLGNYAQPSVQTKFAIADSKINLPTNQSENSATQKITNKPALNFNIALFNEKLALLDWQTTNKRRSPDILIVGSSRALRGIEPQTLEKSLISKGFKDPSVFNLGLDGATARVVNMQLTQILTQPQLPRMIIWADGLRAFNSNRNDITYDEITASAGYKQVQENLKNKVVNPDPVVDTNAIASTPITQSFDFVFSTLAKRQEVRTALVKKFDHNTQMLSNSEALIASTMPNTVTALDSKGFVAFDIKFDPNTYFQKYPQVPGDYDLDYRNFETTGTQFEAFANVVDFCRRNNIELVVVNMPLHSTYLDQSRSRYETTFNGRMQELAAREGFIYLDISQAIPNQAELFSDPSHLNHKGAIEISKLLAQNPKLRWQALKN